MHILNQVEVTDIEQQNNDKRVNKKNEKFVGGVFISLPRNERGMKTEEMRKREKKNENSRK